jgi:hypothetical protein
MSAIKTLLNYNIQIKIIHWSTDSYSEHKATGKLYDSLNDLIDKFTETYIGNYGKKLINEIDTLSFNNPTKIKSIQLMDSFEKFLINELPNYIKEDHTSLLNIRDEMLAEVQKTKYLLSLS